MKEKKDNSFWNVHKRNVIIGIFIIIFLGVFSLITSPKKTIEEDPFVAFHEDQQKQKNPVYSYSELLIELEEGVKQGAIKVIGVEFIPNKISYEFSWRNNTRKVFVLNSLAEEYWFPLFNEHKVSIVPNDTNQGGSSVGKIIWILFFLFFLFFMIRHRQGGTMESLTKIGKVNTENTDKDESCRVTFKDVAGCDEARDEVKEVIDFLKNPAKFIEIGEIGRAHV